jgi:GntR family carbon starvation induced transcriptional regulator
MTSTAPQTRADWVDDRLREAILRGELRPGEKLTAAALAARWDVSQTPLREAFQRLAAEGLVELRPQRGARVAEASTRDAEEVYELRLMLEPRALRDSLMRSDGLHREEIAGAHRRYEQALAKAGQDLTAALDAHRDFHAALLSRCANRRLLELVLELAEHSQWFQVLAVGAPAGHHDVVAEHRTLADDAVAGRVDAAVRHLEEHLRLTVEGVRGAASATA